MTRDGREFVFIWVPSHFGMRGNSAADSAAKDALHGDILVGLIPFSDLKSRTNKYILELWQSEWDEFPENKLHKIFPVLKECIVCRQVNRKEETVMARLHIGHSFITDSFLLNFFISESFGLSGYIPCRIGKDGGFIWRDRSFHLPRINLAKAGRCVTDTLSKKFMSVWVSTR